MMGVGVQGRLLQARRMQGGEGGLRERKEKQNDDMTCGEEGEKAVR